MNFPSDVSLFGKQMLPLLVSIWQLKQQILKVQERILSGQSNAQSNSDWLQSRLSDTAIVVTPATCTYTE
jgi:hypothetical protein